MNQPSSDKLIYDAAVRCGCSKLNAAAISREAVRAMEAALPLADGGTLARILADHFERRDDAFDKADADTQVRYLSAALAVRDAVLS